MKRKPQDTALEGEIRSKRGPVGAGTPSYVVDESDFEFPRDYDFEYTGKSYAASDHDDDLEASSPILAAPMPMTPTSNMSPGRPRFPSDMKTIRCTWPGCSKAFNRPARLNAHLRSHTNERPFTCTYPNCDKSYLEEKHLKQHIKGSHTSERSFTCQESGCGKSFLTSTRLRRHQLVHEGQERFRCRDFPPCIQSFRKHQTLQRHIRSDHLKVSAYPCTRDDCHAGFDTAASLKRHTEREHGEAKFWCEECESKNDADGSTIRIGFPTLELLQRHIQKSHINCLFCDRLFVAREELEEHIEMQHNKSTLNERKKIVCTWDGCNKTFVKQSNLKVHIRSAHEGYRFVCGEIDVSATEDLTSWSQTEGCGDGFSTKGNLENHIRYIHLGMQRPHAPGAKTERQHPPDMLGELTKTSQTARRTIACSWLGCPLKFAQQVDMQNHLRSHLDPNPTEGFEQPFMADHGLASTFDPGMLDFGLAFSLESQPTTPGLGEDWGYPAPDVLAPSHYFQDVEREWQHDEAEMRQLIEPSELADFIDPALQ